MNSSSEISVRITPKKIPFTTYDTGWVILCIGMAIGGGIIFLPVQIGLKGVWVFTLSVLIAYPALYMMQTLYLKTLSQSPECKDYSGVITFYLGKNWGFFLGVAYFIMLLKGMLTYSLAATFDSASYFQTFGITADKLSDNWWYGLAVLALLVSIAAQGEKLLFKISGPMVLVKLAVVVLLGLVMIPHWDMRNISNIPPIGELLVGTVLTLPFTLFSILFVQILSPMNVAFRKIESDPQIATLRALRVSRISYGILVCAVLFFAFSFTFSLSHEQATEAAQNNISAMAIVAKVIPGEVVRIMSVLLNIFAIVTAFFGIFLGFQEAMKGIVVNVLSRFVDEKSINESGVSIGVSIFIVLLLWVWVLTHFPVLLLQQIGAPVYGIVSCIIPCYLVLKVTQLRKYNSWRVLFISATGVLLCLSPFFKLFE
ncbi:amino acid permease [Enterobacter sp. 04-C-01-SI_S15]|uniref:amino acid permease n=1 Tax=Enterobacteriaceae TaxID=543 RepID=UPI00174C5EB7|nr:amino acid permease [Citrobacter freundii]HBM9967990.1 transporter [Enterobacter chengduensis]MBD5594302.1 transporter [Citrobacter freundii]HBH6984910.1 transporter [Citrobacter freundii]HBN0078404.1 transporter [Enterobacter chengduensis]HBN0094463.1 transporter [Enterobacter chengduensis]